MRRFAAGEKKPRRGSTVAMSSPAALPVASRLSSGQAAILAPNTSPCPRGAACRRTWLRHPATRPLRGEGGLCPVLWCGCRSGMGYCCHSTSICRSAVGGWSWSGTVTSECHGVARIGAVWGVESGSFGMALRLAVVVEPISADFLDRPGFPSARPSRSSSGLPGCTEWLVCSKPVSAFVVGVVLPAFTASLGVWRGWGVGRVSHSRRRACRRSVG